jgi:general secretion pathway protein G
MRRFNKNSGFTLIEVVLIIVIMGIIATVAMRTMEPTMDQNRIDATLQEMEVLSQAIIGNKNLISDGIRSDFGYLGDIGALPPDLDALVSNPGDYTTWKGPYIVSDFLENPEDYKKDAWGNGYNFSGVIITSPGNGSPITRRFAENVDELLSNTVNGSIYDGLNAVPGGSAGGIDVIIYYPDGAGSITSATVNPNSSGQFSFSDMIPIGNHLVRAVYSYSADTASAYITVLPGSDVFCQLRFSKSYW